MCGILIYSTYYSLERTALDRERILYQIIKYDNWGEIAGEIDNFLFVFDRMPNQMRLVIDFKIEGKTNKEIAKLLNVTEGTITKQLSRARQRIFQNIT